MKPWMKFNDGELYLGNTISVLRELPAESVDMVITSPPYYSLRSYNTKPVIWDDDINCDHEWVYNNEETEPLNLPPTGGVRKKFEPLSENRGKQNPIKIKSATCKKCGAWKGELGHELTPQLFIKHLCDIFDEVKRVLKPYGSCYVNLGDSYSKRGVVDVNRWNYKEIAHRPSSRVESLPPKCLVQVPSLFSIEMTYGRGWTLRNTIIWRKPNTLPSSVKDRFTNSYEYLFFFTKNEKYYFEQQFEPYKSKPHGGQFGSRKGVDDGEEILQNVQYDPNTQPQRFYGNPGRNKRDVWSIPTHASDVPHFAIFPEQLIETPIKASCPRYVCKKCGKPREKVYVEVEHIPNTPTETNILTETTETIPTETIELLKSMGSDKNGEYHGNEKKDYKTSNAQMPSETKRRILEGIRKEKEEQWIKCSCGVGFEPGVVLDPFMGSGTTAVMARKLNRRWVGVDISETFLKEAANKIQGWKRPDGKDVQMSLLEQGFRPPTLDLDSVW